MGAQGLALSLVLAAPNLAGLLRLFAPGIIYRAGTARRACLWLSSLSYAVDRRLAGHRLACRRRFRDPRRSSAMMALLFAHQLLEYLGTVALWSWWGDLVPPAIRGRYFARRQMVQLAVAIPTLLASGYFADYWREQFKAEPDRLLLAYAIPTAVGAVLLLASLVPLVLMPATRRYPQAQRVAGLVGDAGAVCRPAILARLLVFRSWFSLANGVSQTVQNVIFPKDVLGLGVAPMSAMRVSMQLGQLGASRWVGRASDRFGNRPVLMVAQACVSLSLVFYIVARPQTSWLLLGAWLLFSAYVAHNICLPNLVLKLAPRCETPAYVASNEALGSVFHAAATIAGGLAFDWLRTPFRPIQRPSPIAVA